MDVQRREDECVVFADELRTLVGPRGDRCNPSGRRPPLSLKNAMNHEHVAGV
jgi:hypothetical protein